MHDELTSSIQKWRNTLEHGESITHEQIDELQDHLESEIMRVPEEGLSGEERVLIAAQRVGSPQNIREAYFSADPGYAWRRRVFWMVIGLFGLSVVPQMLIEITQPIVLVLLTKGFVPAPEATTALALLQHAIIWGGVLALAWHLSKRGAQGTSRESWLTRHPMAVCMTLIWITVAAAILAPLMSVLVNQTLNAEVFGQAAYAQAWSAFFRALLVPCLLALLAWKCCTPHTAKR